MKFMLLFLLAVTFALRAEVKMPELYFNPPPRELKLSKNMTTLIADKKCDLEIVAPVEAGETALYAGEELQKFLQQAAQVKIPLLRKRGAAKYAIILGDNAMFKKTFPQIDIAKLTLDGFYILKKNNEIYIAGRDHKQGKKIRTFLKSGSGDWFGHALFERGTLFGAYDFMERFAGIRFFFAGDIGTVVPTMKTFRVPASIHIMDRPDFTSRKVSWFIPGTPNRRDEWYDETSPVRGSNINHLRWRLETRHIPNCHGLAQVGYHHRFGKTHPEYFAMYEDGVRRPVKYKNFAGQLCLTNKGLREEIYKDIKSYLRGEDASVRGIDFFGTKNHFWSGAGFQPGFVNVMPQDWLYQCRCPECQKYYSKGLKASSNLIWEMTAELANRAKKDKLPGYLTQMAYDFYKILPDVTLPDNVLVMYATLGPWVEGKDAQKLADDHIKAWIKKAGRKVAFWNYCINNLKWGRWNSVQEIPHTTPYVIANYYQKRKDYFYGGFLECETHRFIWGVPNIYIASKIFWNNDLDINALIDDFYAKLFGNAAPELKEFFKIIEEKWLATRKIVETPVGPKNQEITQYEVWTKLYPPAMIDKLVTIFDRAEKKVQNDAMSLKRVKFFRKHFLDVILKAGSAYMGTAQSAKDEIRIAARKRTAPADLKKPIYQRGNTAFLRRLKQQKSDISIQAIVTRDAKNLYITFRCEEPEMEKFKYSKTIAEAKKNVWTDALFEIFFNPSGDRVQRYQIAVHPTGYVEAMDHPSRKAWNVGIKARVHVDKKFWSGEVAIPLKAIGQAKGEFPFNLCYTRQRIGEAPYSRIYARSPYTIDDFHQVDKYGTLSLAEPEKSKNLIKDWNFDAGFDGRKLGAWEMPFPDDPGFDGAVEPDSSEFVSGGQSLYLRVGAGAGKRGISAKQNVRLKPDTEYLFSYWVKSDVAKTSEANVIIHVGLNVVRPIIGKTDWQKRSFKFKTPPRFHGNAEVRFIIQRPEAEMWIDNVSIEEIKTNKK